MSGESSRTAGQQIASMPSLQVLSRPGVSSRPSSVSRRRTSVAVHARFGGSGRGEVAECAKLNQVLDGLMVHLTTYVAQVETSWTDLLRSRQAGGIATRTQPSPWTGRPLSPMLEAPTASPGRREVGAVGGCCSLTARSTLRRGWFKL